MYYQGMISDYDVESMLLKLEPYKLITLKEEINSLCRENGTESLKKKVV